MFTLYLYEKLRGKFIIDDNFFKVVFVDDSYRHKKLKDKTQASDSDMTMCDTITKALEGKINLHSILDYYDDSIIDMIECLITMGEED